MPHQTATVSIRRRRSGRFVEATDTLAVEEPLEIRVAFETEAGYVRESISITMRTPGHDAELALGFLYGEGLIRSAEDVREVIALGPAGTGTTRQNVVTVRLHPGVAFDLDRLRRHFYTTSSCGVCGKRSLDALTLIGADAPPADAPVLSPETIHALPGRLRAAQPVFDRTGGLHAAALFDVAGRLIELREDVGRHNAFDKLVGRCLNEGRLPLHGHVVLLSGRASFELLQKAVVSGAPVVAAVGAPSSLAVDLAARYGVTLLGFVRNDRFNVYTAPHRIDDP